MIAEIGHFALILAFAVAIFQMIVPMIGAARGWSGWIDSARPAAVAQFGLIGIAFAALTVAFVTSDFSVLLVYENSHTAKPMLYKISGVWGNHEGSMLLWVLILALFGAAAAVFGDNLPPRLRARVLSVQAAIGAAFLAFILLTSNPFLRPLPSCATARGTRANPIATTADTARIAGRLDRLEASSQIACGATTNAAK